MCDFSYSFCPERSSPLGFGSQELNSHSSFFGSSFFHSYNLAEVISTFWFGFREIWQCDINSHADEIASNFCKEINPQLRDVPGLADVLKIAVFHTGGPHLDRLPEADSADVATIFDAHRAIGPTIEKVFLAGR